MTERSAIFVLSKSSLSVCIATCLLMLWVMQAAAQEGGRGIHRNPLTAATQTGQLLSLYKESHALLVGVSAYKVWPRLSSIPAELNRVEQALKAQNFNVHHLPNPDSHELKDGIENFIYKYGLDPENRLLIYFSGHGHSIGNAGYLVPTDAPEPTDIKDFRRKSLSMTQVMSWARDMVSKHVLFVFDSCFSGAIFKTREMPEASERYIRQATASAVRQFITAGGADEPVPARSTFTPAFVDAIEGKGDTNNDGYVTGSELGVHLSQLVPQFTNQTPQYGKIKDYELGLGDFVFFLPKHDDDDDGSSGGVSNNEPSEYELALWKSTEKGNTKAYYEVYLQSYPKGKFAGIAKLNIDRFIAIEQLQTEEGEAASIKAEEQRLEAEAKRLAEEQLAAEKAAAAAKLAAQKQEEAQQLALLKQADQEQARLRELQQQQWEAQEQALNLTRSTRSDIQRALNTLGHQVGSADGLWGLKTRQGISAWQAQQGFEATGFLTTEEYELLQKTVAKLLPEKVESERKPFEPVMVKIRGGEYKMGSNDGDSNEKPVHSVKIKDFEIGQYEVTFDEYDAYARAAKKALPHDKGWGRGRKPVINVSWDDAQGYVKWLSKETGKQYRLPSEAEWEYAARAGGAGKYSYGNDEPKLCDYANGYNKRMSCDDGSQRTAEVGIYKKNQYGLYDMHGNVYEWVEDCWHSDYKGAPTKGEAWLSGRDCSRRVLRGGSWNDSPANLRSAYRVWNDTANRDEDSGFRVARTLTL